MPKHYRSHRLDVYGVVVHATGTPEGWARLRRRIDCLEEDPAARGYTEGVEWIPNQDAHPARVQSEYHVAVFIDVEVHGDDEAQLVETAAHEATHAATIMLQHLGQPLDELGHEAHAYLVGWLAAWLWSAARDTAAAAA